MSLIVIKRFYDDDCTIGRLTIDKFRCFTLEPRDLDNQQNKSCIYEGAFKYKFRESPKNGRVLELKNVDFRTHIQMHAGCFVKNTNGCILVGDGIRHIDKDGIPDVTNSKSTLGIILAMAGMEGDIRIYS